VSPLISGVPIISIEKFSLNFGVEMVGRNRRVSSAALLCVEIYKRDILEWFRGYVLDENDRSNLPALPELARLEPIRSSLSKSCFLKRLSESIDDQGTLWRLNPGDTEPQTGSASLPKKYVGSIEKDVFYLRRPLLEGSEKVGFTVRGTVVDAKKGSLISVSCAPSPALNLFVGFCGLLFVLSFIFALVYSLSVRLPVGQGLEVMLHCLTITAPLFIGALFLKTYIRVRLFPDRELFEHVARIAQESDPQP